MSRREQNSNQNSDYTGAAAPAAFVSEQREELEEDPGLYAGFNEFSSDLPSVDNDNFEINEDEDFDDLTDINTIELGLSEDEIQKLNGPSYWVIYQNPMPTEKEKIRSKLLVIFQYDLVKKEWIVHGDKNSATQDQETRGLIEYKSYDGHDLKPRKITDLAKVQKLKEIAKSSNCISDEIDNLSLQLSKISAADLRIDNFDSIISYLKYFGLKKAAEEIVLLLKNHKTVDASIIYNIVLNQYKKLSLALKDEKNEIRINENNKHYSKEEIEKIIVNLRDLFKKEFDSGKLAVFLNDKRDEFQKSEQMEQVLASFKHSDLRFLSAIEDYYKNQKNKTLDTAIEVFNFQKSSEEEAVKKEIIRRRIDRAVEDARKDAIDIFKKNLCRYRVSASSPSENDYKKIKAKKLVVFECGSGKCVVHGHLGANLLLPDDAIGFYKKYACINDAITEPNDCYTLQQMATRCGSILEYEYHLEMDGMGKTLLIHALENGSVVKIFEKLPDFSKYPSDMQLGLSVIYTQLALEKNAALISHLLEAGAKVNTVDVNENSAAHYAARNCKEVERRFKVTYQAEKLTQTDKKNIELQLLVVFQYKNGTWYVHGDRNISKNEGIVLDEKECKTVQDIFNSGSSNCIFVTDPLQKNKLEEIAVACKSAREHSTIFDITSKIFIMLSVRGKANLTLTNFNRETPKIISGLGGDTFKLIEEGVDIADFHRKQIGEGKTPPDSAKKYACEYVDEPNQDDFAEEKKKEQDEQRNKNISEILAMLQAVASLPNLPHEQIDRIINSDTLNRIIQLGKINSENEKEKAIETQLKSLFEKYKHIKIKVIICCGEIHLLYDRIKTGSDQDDLKVAFMALVKVGFKTDQHLALFEGVLSKINLTHLASAFHELAHSGFSATNPTHQDFFMRIAKYNEQKTCDLQVAFKALAKVGFNARQHSALFESVLRKTNPTYLASAFHELAYSGFNAAEQTHQKLFDVVANHPAPWNFARLFKLLQMAGLRAQDHYNLFLLVACCQNSHFLNIAFTAIAKIDLKAKEETRSSLFWSVVESQNLPERALELKKLSENRF